MAEEKKKRGFLSAIRESMDKTGGCCGAGETCGPGTCGPVPEEKEKEKKKK